MATDSTDIHQLIEFDSRAQSQQLALQLAQQARREICFVGPNIDAVLFDNSAMIDTLSEFARRNVKTAIHLVVDSTQVNVRHGHRLITLAQRLSSSIHIHIKANQHKDMSIMYMLIDEVGYLYCQNHQRYVGKACLHDPLKVRDLKKAFQQIWNHSVADSNSRLIGL